MLDSEARLLRRSASCLDASKSFPNDVEHMDFTPFPLHEEVIVTFLGADKSLHLDRKMRLPFGEDDSDRERKLIWCGMHQ